MATKATEEQILYGNILNKGMIIGLIGLIVAFIIYALEVMPTKIPLVEVQHYWVMPVHEYLEKSGMHAGWYWITQIGYADMLNLFPIAFLSALTIICYIAILPVLSKKKDTVYVILSIVEVLVLCLAASGILGTGGH